MRLYIPHCWRCQEKIYLDVYAETRSELREKVGSNFQVECDSCGNVARYSVSDVQAEKGANSTAAGTIIGGVIGGLAGGPAGALAGAFGGTVLGANSDEQEREKVNRFNKSV